MMSVAAASYQGGCSTAFCVRRRGCTYWPLLGLTRFETCELECEPQAKGRREGRPSVAVSKLSTVIIARYTCVLLQRAEPIEYDHCPFIALSLLLSVLPPVHTSE